MIQKLSQFELRALVELLANLKSLRFGAKLQKIRFRKAVSLRNAVLVTMEQEWSSIRFGEILSWSGWPVG
jgi:hypothetical protein